MCIIGLAKDINLARAGDLYNLNKCSIWEYQYLTVEGKAFHRSTFETLKRAGVQTYRKRYQPP